MPPELVRFMISSVAYGYQLRHISPTRSVSTGLNPRRVRNKGEKSPLKKPGMVKRLLNHYLEYPPNFHSRPHALFQKIFKECFVIPSAKHGILGNLDALAIAKYGSSVLTGASRYGKLICDCRKMVFLSAIVLANSLILILPGAGIVIMKKILLWSYFIRLCRCPQSL